MTVIEHGKRSHLSIIRLTQEKGAASSFHKVVDTVNRVFITRGLLVTDKRKTKMMIKTLNSWAPLLGYVNQKAKKAGASRYISHCSLSLPLMARDHRTKTGFPWFQYLDQAGDVCHAYGLKLKQLDHRSRPASYHTASHC